MQAKRQTKGQTKRQTTQRKTTNYTDPRNPYITRRPSTYHHKITKEKVWDGYIIPM